MPTERQTSNRRRKADTLSVRISAGDKIKLKRLATQRGFKSLAAFVNDRLAEGDGLGPHERARLVGEIGVLSSVLRDLSRGEVADPAEALGVCIDRLNVLQRKFIG